MSDKSSAKGSQHYYGSPVPASINAPSTWGTVQTAPTPTSNVYSLCGSPSPSMYAPSMGVSFSPVPSGGSHGQAYPAPAVPTLNPALDYYSPTCMKFNIHSYRLSVAGATPLCAHPSFDAPAFNQSVNTFTIQFNASPAWRFPMDTVRFRMCPSIRAVLDAVVAFLYQQNAQDARAAHFLAPQLADRNLNIPSNGTQTRLDMLGQQCWFRGMTLSENGVCVVYLCSADQLRC